jgi:hypothetical protein
MWSVSVLQIGHKNISKLCLGLNQKSYCFEVGSLHICTQLYLKHCWTFDDSIIAEEKVEFLHESPKCHCQLLDNGSGPCSVSVNGPSCVAVNVAMPSHPFDNWNVAARVTRLDSPSG